MLSEGCSTTQQPPMASTAKSKRHSLGAELWVEVVGNRKQKGEIEKTTI